ncbi:MAG: A/G-specific adenine glycosylase [Bacteroidia bacterium]|nr:A/G-specific adenine glycosylase [Bacteroidia bacterium]
MQKSPVKDLLEWYAVEGRNLPWRESSDPYQIWISEVILQQTRVAQGLSYFQRFMERFPTVEDLAAASQDEVLKYWEGLGYYSRARNLHQAARTLITQFKGVFPPTWEELLGLKGIGPYTARAIGAFAFGNEVGVIDGNVFRVVSRYTGDFSPIDLGSTRKKFQILVDKWAAEGDPADYNQAMMDLGATVCLPRNPNCAACPVQEHCVAHQKSIQHSLPVKQNKVSRSVKYFNYYLEFDPKQQIKVRQRPETGIWAGLWEIPNEEVEAEAWNEKAFSQRENLLGEMKHVLTHLDLMIRVYRADSPLPEGIGAGKFISMDKISIFAFSRAVLKIFDNYLPKNS